MEQNQLDFFLTSLLNVVRRLNKKMHAYLIGALGLGIIFTLLCFVRKDLRRVMIYSGLLYLAYGFIMFLAIKLLSSNPVKTVTPGYWGPPSLFSLNNKTGGYGIEDALFSFFAGGIAASLYEVVFKLKVSSKTNNRLKRGHVLAFALIVSSVIYALTPLNAIYFFIFLQLFGALAIVWQRKDLLLHSLAGGIIFMLFYAVVFAIFNFLFPHFIGDYYHLSRTSHILIGRVPLEEYLYAFTLGMMWAPIYEYEFRVKDSSYRRRTSGFRRFSLAAVAAKR